MCQRDDEIYDAWIDSVQITFWYIYFWSSTGAQQAVAAQDLTSVFKAGYLEKRRKGRF